MHPFEPKYILYYSLAAAGICLLLRRWVRRWNRNALQVAAFVILGGVLVAVAPGLEPELGLHPSPMCSLGRLLQVGITKGFAPKLLLVSLAVILILSLAARKLFCGWACPLGAFQELLHAVPWVKKAPKLPFLFTNSVRIYLLAITVLGLVLYGVYLYEPINAFELLHWELDYSALVLGIGLLSLASLFYYRPYCYLVCPIGLVTWCLERVALLRVRFHPERCTGCGSCRVKAPCPTIDALLDRRCRWLPDCTSCGVCLDACATGALDFGIPIRSRAQALPAAGEEPYCPPSN